jgi:hypothetical protein
MARTVEEGQGLSRRGHWAKACMPSTCHATRLRCPSAQAWGVSEGS